MRLYLPAFILLCLSTLQAQTSKLPIGGWTNHFSYKQVKDLAQSDSYMYLATPLSILVVDKEDRSSFKLDEITALSETGIQRIAFNKESKTLLVAYTNNKIDLLKEEGLRTLSDLQNFQGISGNKEITEIVMDGPDKAWLATNFGLILLRLDKEEFASTTFTGEKTYDVAVFKDSIYLAAEDGLYRIAQDHPFIEDFSQWTYLGTESGFPSDYSVRALATFNGHLYLATDQIIYSYDGQSPTPIYDASPLKPTFLTAGPTRLMAGFDKPNDIAGGKVVYFFDDDTYTDAPDCLHRPRAAEEDEKGNVWFADLWSEIYIHDAGQNSCSTYYTNSPYTSYVYSITLSGNEVWVATGGVNPNWTHTLRPTGILHMKNGVWQAYNQYSRPDLDEKANDFLQVLPHPSQEKVYAASYYNGLYEFDGSSFKLYNSNNSPLQTHPDDTFHTRVIGLAFDESENLWISNHSSPTPICVLQADGNWQCFTPPCGETSLAHLLIDQNGYKWFTITTGTGGLMVFDEGDWDKPEDDRCRIISTSNSLLPDNVVNCIAMDLDGEIWLGTTKGPIAFSCGSDPFDEELCQGNKRIGELDDFGAYLLETENILSIAIDGANRKWFGTENGAFLLSPDGKEQLAHLTAENSFLPDNTVLDIAIQPETGEIWFGTNAGLTVLRGEATVGDAINKPLAQVFPNPVRPDYDGPIAINGLARDANVKITDAYGRLVYEGTALGGQAIWDGRDYTGRRAATGVYLVYSTSDLIFGKPNTLVAKIVFVR